MAFIPVKRIVAAAPVSALFYGADASVNEISFVAQYARHKRKEVIAINAALHNRHITQMNEANPASAVELVKLDDGSIPVWSHVSDEAFILEKMIGWVGVTDESNVDKTFTKEAIEEVLADYPELIVPLFNGFFAAHSEATKKEEKEKN